MVEEFIVYRTHYDGWIADISVSEIIEDWENQQNTKDAENESLHNIHN